MLSRDRQLQPTWSGDIAPINESMLAQRQDYDYINQKPGITHGKDK